MVRTTILTYRGSVRLPGTLIQGSFPSDGAALFPSEVEAIFVGILALTSEKKRALEANRCVDFLGRGDSGLFNFHFMKVDFVCSAAFGDS